MNQKKSIKWKYFANLILCSVFLYLYCKNSLLRPSPPSIQNREFFIGALLLFICYLNALVLHPLLYRQNKTLAYLIWSTISIIVSLSIEFFWLYSGIMDCILKNLTANEAQKYFRLCVLFAALINTGLLSFTFLVCEFNWNRNKEKSLERLLMESEHKIIVKDLMGIDVLLNYRQIRYCEQEENFTKIYGMGDSVYFRYGSLKNFQNIFNDNFFIQINRKTLVAKNQIKSFTDRQLWITNEENPFEISNSFQLQKDPLLINRNSEPLTKKKTKRKKKNKKNTNSKNIHDIYQIITENPVISAVMLAEQTQLSQSTVNRFLKQLKDEGLIEYVGSKKTGGYQVIQRQKTKS